MNPQPYSPTHELKNPMNLTLLTKNFFARRGEIPTVQRPVVFEATKLGWTLENFP